MAMQRSFPTFLFSLTLAATGCAVDDAGDEEPALDEIEAEVGSLSLTMSTFDFDLSTHDDAHKIYVHGVNQGDHVDMIVGNYTGGDNSRTYDVEAWISGECFGGFGPRDLLPMFSEPVHLILGPGESVYLRGDCELSMAEARMSTFYTQL